MRILNFKILFFFLYLMSVKAFATNYLFGFGGTGDAVGKDNIFITSMAKAKAVSDRAHWQTSFVFDGDQPDKKTEFADILKTPNMQDFNQDSFSSSLIDIAAGHFTSQDKVLFVIDTHGTLQTTVNGHEIVCSKESRCDSGDLKAVVEKLQQKGVQVAIADFSCYSGQTLKMKNSKTCVISGTSEDDVGFSSTPEFFFSALDQGTSLEQAFLVTKSKATGRPRISTEAGLAAEKVIAGLSLESRAGVTFHDIENCPTTFSADEIKKAKSQFSDIAFQSAQYNQAAQSYIEASKEYQRIYQKYVSEGKRLKQFMGYPLEKIQASDSKTRMMNWIELTSMTENSIDKTGYQKKLELEQSNPAFKKFEADYRAFNEATTADIGPDSKRSDLAEAAIKTQKYEKELYLELYKHYKGNEENPCAKFTF